METHVLLVEICDETGMSAGTMRMMRLEVERIYERAGVEIAWMNCRQECHAAMESPDEAAVYVRERLPESLQRSERTLGFDFAECGQSPDPVIYLSRTAIEKFIGRRSSLAPHKLGRALGRTMAHELAHQFLRQREHTNEGILRARFSREELTEALPKLFFFTREQVDRLQTCARSSNEPGGRSALTKAEQ